MWIDVSSIHAWAVDDPVLNWLDTYGAQAGFIGDTDRIRYAPECDLGAFVRSRAQEFEKRVVHLLAKQFDIIRVEHARSNHDDVYQETLRLINTNCDAIYQGLVRNSELGVFGVPDFLIRGYALQKLLPGLLIDEDPSSYYVLDVKFKGLSLNKNGDVSSGHKWEKVQLSLYESGLAEALGRNMARAFLLGRALSGKDGAGGGCFDQAGWVKTQDTKVWSVIREGIAWVQQVRDQGASWTLEPPSDPHLFPNLDNKEDSPWHLAKRELAERLKSPPSDGPNVLPIRIKANRAEWETPERLEFYVDFETLNSLNDDFSELPVARGFPMIFMIGCGHEVNEEFEFHVWTAEQETPEEEERIIRTWLSHMESVGAGLNCNSTPPRVFHWFRHEPLELAKAATRHGQQRWHDVQWYDILDRVMKAEPVQIKGVSNHSLKPVTRTLKDMGYISTVWGESPVSDGTAAMAAAWHCYEQSRARGIPAGEVTTSNGDYLITKIAEYNEVDCKAMWEILRYLRKNH